MTSSENKNNIIVQIADKSDDTMSMSDIEKKIKKLDTYMAKIDQKVKRFEGKMAQLTEGSQKEKDLINLGVKLIDKKKQSKNAKA